MVDQHAALTTDVEFPVWTEIFKASLKQIGKALIVLTPGEDPIAITRSWCCFEWASIGQPGISCNYCMSPRVVERLLDKMSKGIMVVSQKSTAKSSTVVLSLFLFRLSFVLFHLCFVSFALFRVCVKCRDHFVCRSCAFQA